MEGGGKGRLPHERSSVNTREAREGGADVREEHLTASRNPQIESRASRLPEYESKEASDHPGAR